jgi:hypothetical protein
LSKKFDKGVVGHDGEGCLAAIGAKVYEHTEGWLRIGHDKWRIVGQLQLFSRGFSGIEIRTGAQ